MARLAVSLAFIIPVVAACGAGPGQLDVVEAPGAVADHSFVIPAGAGAAHDRGETLEILPAEMAVKVGEVIEIVNRDERGHLVGPFFVGAGETLRQRFTGPGEFAGVCTVHPSGRLVLVVRP